MKNKNALSFDELEKLWRENTEKARELVKAKKQNQLQIATLCLETCDISHGGDRKKIEEFSSYTIKRFAQEVGINHKTLYNWCLIKTNVYDKLENHIKEKANFSQLTHINRYVNRETTAQNLNKVAKAFIENDQIDRMILRYTTEIRALIFNLEKPNIINIKKETAEELNFYINKLNETFKNVFPKSKAINHENLSRYSPKNNKGTPNIVGYMKNDAGMRVRISLKHQAIYNFLRQQYPRYIAPSTIGNFVKRKFNNKFKNPTPFACRHLRVLQSVNLVERNGRGQWKAIKKDLFI